jgi:Holliday junction resolvase RusA-like endonuclease
VAPGNTEVLRLPNPEPLVRFFVAGRAVPWARAGRRATPTRSGKFHFTRKRPDDYRVKIIVEARKAMGLRRPYVGPLALTLIETRCIPTTWSKRRQAEAVATGIDCATRSDLDNVIKIVGDALNKLVWIDDGQICAITASKRYGVPEGLQIEVRQR